MSAWEPGLSALSEGPASMAYVPRLLPPWAAAEPEPAHRVVDGSLVFFDITGFTPLTERLARKGREGAEELSNLLDTVFGRLLMGAEDEGGDLLAWGGDALLLLFDGPDHARRAARAALGLQRALAQLGRAKTSIGRVVLHASAAVESGPIDLVLGGNPAVHRELVVLGPTATRVTMLEHAAAKGSARRVTRQLRRWRERHTPRVGWGHLLVGAPATPSSRQPDPSPSLSCWRSCCRRNSATTSPNRPETQSTARLPWPLCASTIRTPSWLTKGQEHSRQPSTKRCALCRTLLPPTTSAS